MRSFGGHCGDRCKPDSSVPAKTTPLRGVATPASSVAACSPGSGNFASVHLPRLQAVHEGLEIRDACCHDAHALDDLYYNGWLPHVEYGMLRVERAFVEVYVTHDRRYDTLHS